jgi:hypothetical protein
MGGQTAHQPRKMTPPGFSSTFNEYPLSPLLATLRLRHLHNLLCRRPRYCEFQYLSPSDCWFRFHSGYLCHSHYASNPRSITVVQENVDDEDDQKERGEGWWQSYRRGHSGRGRCEKRKEESPVERAGACIRPSYCSWRVVRRVGIGMGAQRLPRTPREEKLMLHPSRPV